MYQTAEHVQIRIRFRQSIFSHSLSYTYTMFTHCLLYTPFIFRMSKILFIKFFHANSIFCCPVAFVVQQTQNLHSFTHIELCDKEFRTFCHTPMVITVSLYHSLSCIQLLKYDSTLSTPFIAKIRFVGFSKCKNTYHMSKILTHMIII